MRTTMRTIVFVLALVLLQGLSRAKKAGPNPTTHLLLSRLTSMSVVHGREHRGLLVYPLVADAKDPPRTTRALTAGEAAKAKNLSIGELPKKHADDKVEIFNWGLKPVLLLAGEVLEGGVRDRYLARDVLLSPGSRVAAPVLPGDAHARKAGDQKRVLLPVHAIAPGILRLVGATDRPADAAEKAIIRLFEFAHSKSTRRSLPILYRLPDLAARVSDYRTTLSGIPQEEDGKVIGAACYVGDRLVGIDLFGTNAEFRAHWPSLLAGLSVEATLYESVSGYLKKPFPIGRDVDRHMKDVRALLRKPFAAVITKDASVGKGLESKLVRAPIVGRVLVDAGRFVHAVLLNDKYDLTPAAPPVVTPPTSNPTEVSRAELERRAARGTLTEAEKRLLERMRKRNQPPPKFQPPRTNPRPPSNQPPSRGQPPSGRGSSGGQLQPPGK